MIMCLLFLEDPPYLKTAKTRRIDYIGFGLLVIWIGCLQILLDKGQDEDWFSSMFIRWLATGASVGLFVFLSWELRVKDPIVELRILSDRNLAIAVFLMFVVGAILFSTTAVLPRFLQTLLGYSALESGLVLSPRGIGAVVGSIIAGQILSKTKIDGRIWMAQGAVVLALSMVMFGSLSLEIAPGNLANCDQSFCDTVPICPHEYLFGRHSAERSDGGCHRPHQSGPKPRRFGRNFSHYDLCRQRDSSSPGVVGKPSDAS